MASGCQPHGGDTKVTTPPARSLSEVLATHTPELMRVPGVVGTAESRLADGRPCVVVMVSRMTDDLRRQLPKELEGWPVRIEVTGELHAMPDSR